MDGRQDTFLLSGDESSPRIQFVCQLIDVRHEPMASDVEMFRWLVENNLPVLVIATKADKIGKNAVVAVVDVGVALVGPGETFLAPKLARFEIPSILSNTSSSGRTVPRGVNSDGAAYLALTGATCFEVA